MTKRFFQYTISGDRAAHARRGVGPATDYETPTGTVIDAPFAGKMTRRDTRDGGYGLKLDGDKYIFMAQHLHERITPRTVAHRADIAISGNTGKTSGPHVHAWILIKATGERISFQEWLDQYVNGPKSAPRPAGKPSKPATLVGRELQLTSQYWYRSAADADKLRNARGGNRGGGIMLSGPYKIRAVHANGSIQVLSNSVGLVWIHESAVRRLA